MGDAASDQRDREPLPSDRGAFVRAGLLLYGLMGCIALVWRMWTPGATILHPDGVLPSAGGGGEALVAGVTFGLVGVALSECITRFTPIGETLADELGTTLAGVRTADALLLALASGIAEEMFFRGALQPEVGIFWASALFGACHFLPRREFALWSLYATGMGFALGWLFEWTGHLLAPVAAHVVVNGINLPRLARRAESRRDGSSSSPDGD
jgi:hypothetical protein